MTVFWGRSWVRLGKLDLRSLAAYRVGLGCLILADLIWRAPYLAAHYSDTGILPRKAWIGFYAGFPSRWSLHGMWGSSEAQACLFVLAGLAAIGLIVGMRTRAMIAISWLLLTSLHNRNPMILQGGDSQLRLMLFWSMFLPLGAWASWDGWQQSLIQAKNRTLAALSLRPTQLVSLGTWGLLIQFGIVYAATAFLKSGDPWLKDFSAVYLALSLDQMTTPFATWLRTMPKLLMLATPCVLAFEYLVPGWLLASSLRPRLRMALVAALFAMHISLVCMMEIGLFPWINMVAAIAFLPGAFWDKIGGRLQRLMQKGVKKNRWKEFWVGFCAGDSHGFVPADLLAGPRKAAVGCAWVLALASVLTWNVIAGTPSLRPASWFSHAVHFFRLDQKWSMFAPKPFLDDGWYVMPGQWSSGREWDLASQAQVDQASRVDSDHVWDSFAPIAWEKPKNVSKKFGNYRWRKYLRNLWLKKNRHHRVHYGRYVCRQWNQAAKGWDALETFQMVYMKELTPKMYAADPKPEPRVVWRHRCFKQSKDADIRPMPRHHPSLWRPPLGI